MSGKRDPELGRPRTEEAPLIARSPSTSGSKSSKISESDAKSLYKNFILMCIAFSLNHGCVVSCLTYATTELGDDLGGYGSGALYICYSLTSFFVSKPVVTFFGPKNGLLLGVTGYCIYVIGFLLSVIFPSIAWPVFVPCAAIGGIAGGLLWTSQGRYFAKNASQYADAAGIPVTEANSTFAGIFASTYLGFETLTKVIATVIFLSDTGDSAKTFVFSFYSIAALFACFGIIALHHLNDFGTYDMQYDAISKNTLAAGNLIYNDKRLALMIPFQVAFGLTSSFVPYYVFGTVVADSDTLGSTYVGFLSAIIVLTGATMAMPSAWLANKFGKPFVMSIGGVCLAFVGFVFYCVSDATLGTWSMIIPFFIIYGIGRGTWENTNKAVIADLFVSTPDQSTAAFASIAFSNGLAGALAYFAYPSLTRITMASLVFVFSVKAVFCYYASVYYNTSGKDSAYRRAVI